MSKRTLRYLSIFYHNGDVEEVREDKLEKKHVNSRKVDFILSPSIGKNLVYNIVKPSTLLLAKRFVSNMVIQCAEVEYDDYYIQRLGDIPSSIETTSVVQFIQYITTLYRLYGFSEIMESSNMIKDYNNSFAFYPIAYSTEFYDASGRLMERIENYNLPQLTEENYECTINDNLFAWITEGRLCGYKEILFECDSKTGDKSVMDTPKLIQIFKNNNSWIPLKKLRQLKTKDRALFRIDGFGSYMLISRHIWELITGRGRVDIWTYSYIEPEKYNDEDPTEFRVKMLDNIKELFENNMVENFHGYDLILQWKIRDSYIFSQWLIYAEDLISYLNIVTYFTALRQDEFVESDLTVADCVTYLWMDNPSQIFTNNEIMKGKFKESMFKLLTLEGTRNE